MKRQKLNTIPVIDLPNLLFEDRFIIRSVDHSKFENVGRIRGKSSGFDAELILDINTALYKINEKDNITVALTTRVSSANLSNDSVYNLIDTKETRKQTLMDQYDYVMYGTVFKIEDKSSDRRTIHTSFGGLLMSLTADKQVVSELVLDMKLFILIKKQSNY